VPNCRDKAFIDAMVPHHQGAVDMAEVALENADHQEIRSLAEDIVSAQEAEIEELKAIKQQEFGTPEVPMEMSAKETKAMGMTDPGELATKDPFDKAFIDAMIPHHRSAIEMASVALQETDNARIEEMVWAIVDAHKKEIAQMQCWREEWYPQGQGTIRRKEHTPMHGTGTSLNRLAFSATAHCLTGCAIGEVLGMVIGTALGWGDFATIALAVVLAFFFGYSLTMVPLLRSGLALGTVLPLAFAADTLSITIMEIVDNAVMLVIPGAMEAGLTSVLFWGSLAFALGVAFVAAYPANRWLIARGRGHAVVHEYHGGHHGDHEHH
jgi:uncharacterized protein (DUF305 family)